MARRLSQNLNSAFVEAANRLNGRTARKKIVVYVESFDDVLFWTQLLRPLETDEHSFEVMLPSRTSLCKGKKIAMGNRLGNYMIACVDADYDYLMQGSNETSLQVCTSPYVFHTYAYAIESFQCYAPSLHQVCVMATLNDHRIFDFETFLTQYSHTIWPLFVWNVWAYRHGKHTQFSMLNFHHIVRLEDLNFYHPEQTIQALRKRVNAKIARLQRQFPEAKKSYKPLMEEIEALGITPELAYMHMRGHDLYDGVVAPIITTVCEALRREREREIRRLAEHAVQMQNELASYTHATAPVEEMLRKHHDYVDAPQYQRIVSDLQNHLKKLEAPSEQAGNTAQ